MRTTVPDPTPDRSRAAPGVTDPLDALLPHHRRMLVDESGIAPEVVAERRYRSLRQADAGRLRTLGFTQRGLSVPGLLVPVWAPDGADGRYQYRPDAAWCHKDGRAAKYVSPPRTAPCLDVPPRCREQIRDANTPLYITEGAKKADAGASHGLCALALAGVWNWVGRNEYGAVTSLPEWRDVALKGRVVYVVFDSDAVAKLPVWQAMEALKDWLEAKGARVKCLRLPAGPNGEKVGLDDFLRTHDTAALAELAEEPEPERPQTGEDVEWLDATPATISRPLALVDGRAYAAVWVPIKRRLQDDDGQWVEKVETVRVVVRDDGEVFGPGGRAAADLAITVQLAQPVRDYHAWTVPSVKAFKAGRRPSIPDVFRRLVATYDYFLDFPKSPEGHERQRIMCEVSACLSLATWLTPALTVVGYPWPNGPAGSGKTKYAQLWAGTSYLGQLVLSSGTFASIRDLVDYGAAIAFDDAEVLADPRKSDPQKRELLLAGHHKGAVVSLKEPAADGKGWVTRYLDPFGFKAFTAIKLPDPVLASRSIIIPLVRTASEKGNRDPADDNRWPHDRRRLQDDLWATALTLLARAEQLWATLEGETSLIGRDFEPWRPVLLVATLLEEAGVAGLVQRIREAMGWYQEEKADFTLPDRTVLVIHALLAMLKAAGHDMNDIADINDNILEWSASDVLNVVKVQAAEEGLEDTEWMTAQWIGRVLSQLRFQRNRTMKRRYYRLTPAAVASTARAYGLLPSHPPPAEQPAGGIDVINVMEAAAGAADDNDASTADLPEGDVIDVSDVIHVMAERGTAARRRGVL
jgi:hypothetical protein